MKLALVILIGGILFVIALQFIKVYQAIQKASLVNKPYVQYNPQAGLRILFIGDSTAKGTGAKSNTQSVAGWLGQDFPQAHIENEGVDGRKIKELAKFFTADGRNTYDLVVIQIGGNDILKFTSLKHIGPDLTAIITRAKQIGRHVVILHSGNVGLAPVFIWPFDHIMTARALEMRALYIQKAKEEGVSYIDLFTQRREDLFLKDINRYYAQDHLHPSGQGYRWWYERIRQTLDKEGINPFVN